ncbi:hypothetical protein ACK2M2_13180 [Acinetobacter sp. TY1]|uniref:hypothetical protein n=1 Tax=unclassified Acinetobacter TaxID=196816 RepID=UPI00301F8218
MNSILLGMLLLYLAIALLVWQLTKIKKDFIASQIEVSDLKNRVKAQEDHLKATLNIMQDLAKKMQVQQEAMDVNIARLTQVEIQNAELVGVLTRSIQHAVDVKNGVSDK